FLNLSNGSNLFVETDITTTGGHLSVGADSVASSAAAVHLQRGGATLNGGSLLAEKGGYVGGGTLLRRGLLGNALFNAGQVQLGGTGNVTGELVVLGDYVQTAGALLTAKLGGTDLGRFDQLTVQGSAVLDGTFTAVAVNAFTPELGDEFRVLN